jgi:putative acetyltransferase
MPLSLRSLVPADAPAVHRLGLEVARTLGGLPSDREEATAQRIADLAPDRGLHLGAFDDDGLAGVLTLDGMPHVRRKHVAMISIGVLPSKQRRGVGDALLRAAVAAADDWWAFFRLELGVHADNHAAIRLYEKHGFVVETQRPKDMLRDGVLVDGLGMARIRPGFVAPPETGSEPPIPPRGPRREVTVRPVRVSDAEAFARLHEEPSVMEGTFQLPHQTRASWEKRLSAPIPNLHVLLAEIEGRVVGSAGLFPLGQSARLRHQAGFGISVHPDVQGQGVGHALLKAITSLADDYVGLERIVLEVYVDNARARALYERFGFVVEGTQRMVAFRRGTYVDAFQMGRLRHR